MSDTAGERPHWVPSPLLLGAQETPRFLRAPWDAAKADAFGPWRVTPAVDPALTLEREPVDAPVDSAPVVAGEGAAAMAEAPQIAEPAAPVEPGPSPQQLQALEAQAHARGLEEGRLRALAELAAQRTQESELVRSLVIEMRALREDPDRFFEPLRRLALHIAEQLVRGELQASGEAIAQIVRQCLQTLDEPSGEVIVGLHADDLALLEAMKPPFLEGLRLQPEPGLLRGSVRLRLDDTVLEDLIEHRLEAIVQRLLARPGPGLGESPLLRDTVPAEAVEARGLPVRRARAAVQDDLIDAAAFPVPDPTQPPAP